MSRGDFQADVTFGGVDRLGNSVSMFYALGAVGGTNLTLAGGANAVYAASWTGGSIQAAYVGSIVAIRGAFSPTVTLTGQSNGYSLSLLSAAVGGFACESIILAAGGGTIVAAGWGPGTFQATFVNSVVVRGDLSASLRLTDKGLSGLSMLVLSVTGSLDGVELRARYGINTIVAGSSRNSLVLAGVADAVTDLPTAADFLAPADPNRAIAINTFMISNSSGVFENSIVSAPTLGTVILRGVEQAGTGPFGLAVDATVRLYVRYLAGASPDYHSNLTESLEADGQFQVLVV
jgi:hypothetical protein